MLEMADGFAWNGQTYDSLSKVAFAITGTWGVVNSLARRGCGPVVLVHTQDLQRI
jgi:hypothetical protein